MERFNYFIHLSANVFAESLNARNRHSGAQLTGVANVPFFLYRPSKTSWNKHRYMPVPSLLSLLEITEQFTHNALKTKTIINNSGLMHD